MLKAAPSRMGARDGVVSDTSADIAWQEFSVPYRFPVTFTDGLFEGSNRTLRDRRKEKKRKEKTSLRVLRRRRPNQNIPVFARR